MIEVAVIPAAGRGTRMRDATRAVPKPLLTVIDRPAIQWVMDEAIQAGIKEFVLVVSPKSLLPEHFESSYAGASVRYAYQEEPLGLGHAIAVGGAETGGRSFLCLLSDNLAPPLTNPSRELIEAFTRHSVVGVRSISDELLESYGVAVVDDTGRVQAAIEKPGMGAPSSLGLVGRYVFTAEILDLLASASVGHGGEIQLTDSIHRLATQGVVMAHTLEADLLDTGTPAKMLEAIVTLARGSEEYGPGFEEFLMAVQE